MSLSFSVISDQQLKKEKSERFLPKLIHGFSDPDNSSKSSKENEQKILRQHSCL